VTRAEKDLEYAEGVSDYGLREELRLLYDRRDAIDELI
jgi:hypothetical protein